MTPEELERRYAEAHRAWQANPVRETERAVERAADALRRARRGEYVADGVTNAELGEVFADDDDAMVDPLPRVHHPGEQF